MAVFITGTDTGVGKTIACAALMRRHARVANLRYWKPVQTGAPPDSDTDTVRDLAALQAGQCLPPGWLYEPALSPHRAAELAGEEIPLAELTRRFERHAAGGPLICEGAGGLLVPLNRKTTWLDLLRAVRPSIVLVARTALGTINHSLLTIDVLRRAGLTPVGVLFAGTANPDNEATVCAFGRVPSLGQFHFSGTLDPAAIEALDPDGLLPGLF